MHRNARHVSATAAALALALALSACSGGTDDSATEPPGTTTSSAADATGAGPAATSPPTGDEHSASDVMFSRMMIPHHQQAIEMSDILLAKSDIPADVVALAEQIKAEQGPEIEQMTTWLEQWGQPGPGAGPMGDDGHGQMNGHGGHGDGRQDDDRPRDDAPMSGPLGEDMPMMDGMLSPAELRQLGAAEGTDAVRMYLEKMIAHHEGAIDMARQEVENGTYPATVELARSIIDTQQREIDTMRGMLSGM